jgi:glutamate-5-semialdehyde dehydrogenase
VKALAAAAKAAARSLSKASSETKDAALRAMAAAVRARSAKILAANALEVGAAQAAGKSKAFVDRLALNPVRLKKIAIALEGVAKLPDPVGRVREYAVRPNGLVIRKMRVPLGVLAVLYESRPGVTADAAGLCVKSGNASILRGGKEAVRTNGELADALAEGLAKAGLPEACVQVIRDPGRSAVGELLKLEGLIDLVIPRGGPELTRRVRRESSIPVLSHDRGVCHTFVDASADVGMAVDVCLNAKAERPGVCNAMETLLVHKKIAPTFLPKMAAAYGKAGVELRGDEAARRLMPAAKAASDEDWDAEYLDLILSVKVVGSLDEALAHIARHGTGLAEAIVTQDESNAARFQREAEAGAVYVNASTRFTDGGEFGMGAEMGISTQKIHAWGPVGLEELTTEKFVINGTGQVRDSSK